MVRGRYTVTKLMLFIACLGMAPSASTSAFAQSLTTVAIDPFTSSTCTASNTTYHKSIVEPDSFSYGNTIVAAFQVGRIYDGGACAIGFSTSTNNGSSWTSGIIPKLTKHSGGTYDRVTDPAVAYDAKHNVWLVSSLVLTEAGGVKGVAIYTSRSTDGGSTWGDPVLTDDKSLSPDKNWIVCDNTASSPYYGNCYTEWDDNGAGNKLYMRTSSDGGLTWGAQTTNGRGVIGGQPVVHPNGTVIVPTANANETAIGAFNSTDGGKTWSALTTIATVKHHTVAGSLREGPLPTAEIDGAGTVYVAWTDCRFRTACKTNDIVFSKSLNATGTSWSNVTRVPIDTTNSGVDHFTPGLAVDKSTSGSTARLGLTYYYYASGSTLLNVGFISSNNGGAKWSLPQSVGVPAFPTSALATTSQGRMFGDYISTSFDSRGYAHGIFVVANQPGGTVCSSNQNNCNEYVATFSLAPATSVLSAGNEPILFSGNGGAKAQSFWNIVDNNGIKHRD